MSIFYVAWVAKPPASFPRTTFDYLIHPNPGDGGVRYFYGMVEAPDERLAWKAVLVWFPDAKRNLIEKADPHARDRYAQTCGMAGVHVVKANT